MLRRGRASKLGTFFQLRHHRRFARRCRAEADAASVDFVALPGDEPLSFEGVDDASHGWWPATHTLWRRRGSPRDWAGTSEEQMTESAEAMLGIVRPLLSSSRRSFLAGLQIEWPGGMEVVGEVP